MKYVIIKKDKNNNLYSYANELYKSEQEAVSGIMRFVQRDMLFLSASKDKKVYVVEYDENNVNLVNKAKNEKEYEKIFKQVENVKDDNKDEKEARYLKAIKDIKYSEIIFRYIVEEVPDNFQLPKSDKEKLSFITFMGDLNKTIDADTNIGDEDTDNMELTVNFCNYCVRVAQNIKLNSSEEITLKYDERIPNRAYLVQGNNAVCTMIIYSSQAHEILI